METNRSIKCWAEDDRPREKMLLKGKAALSDAELIAILLGSGTPALSAVDVAKELLAQSENNLHLFGQKKMSELTKVKGIGQAKAITLMAAIELGKRRQAVAPVDRFKITSSEKAFQLLAPDLQELTHEEFYVLYLNKGNHVLQKKQISIGGLSGTIADGKVIYRYALELNATGIILAHNHPSGRLEPSEEDRRVTKNLKAFGKLIDIEVLDHLIISEKGFFSFAEEGLMV
jgi:DNA repair protein RadC